MTEAVAQILSHIDSLSQQERAEVAYAVICSLEPEEEGVAEAWDAELSRRVAAIKAGRAVGKPADQLFAELREERP
jgi:putative addiction module component (TIGR02574 family)